MKKFLAFLLTAVILLVPMAVCNGKTGAGSTSSTVKPYRVAFACHDLTNPTFAEVSAALKKLGQKNSIRFTVLDCGSNASKQITQVENFIQTGVNAIIIQAADAAALKSVLKRAMDKGIKVISWDEDLGSSCDSAWVIKNYDLGVLIGTAAANWNNQKLGGKGEIAILDYPSLSICVERAKGITDTIHKLAPNAKIVARATTLTVAQGMANTETILRAHPNVRIFACVGDGDAIGAVQAIKAAFGKNTDLFGTFSADGTQEALAGMLAGDPIRMTVSYGTASAQAKQLYEIVTKLLNGQSVPKLVYKTLTPVTISNAKQFYTK
jgi:ribose transport system substrate-binding protein